MESTSLQSESLSYFTSWLKSASGASITCGTMVSYTKLIAHSSSAVERFSKEVVGVKLTWSAGKCTLVTVQETGEGLKMVRAVKRSVNLCCDTVRLTLQVLRFAEKGEYRLFSLYKILKRLVKSLQIQDTLSPQTRP